MAALDDDTLMRDIDDLDDTRKSRKRARDDDDDLTASSLPATFTIGHSASVTATWPGQEFPPLHRAGSTFYDVFAYIADYFAKYYLTARTEVIGVPNMDGSKRRGVSLRTSRGHKTYCHMPGCYPRSDGSISDQSSQSDEEQGPSGQQNRKKAREGFKENDPLTPPPSRPQSQQYERPADLSGSASDLPPVNTLRERDMLWEQQMQVAKAANEKHHSALNASTADARTTNDALPSSSSSSSSSSPLLVESSESHHQHPHLPASHTSHDARQQAAVCSCLSYQLEAEYGTADSQNANTVARSSKEKQRKFDLTIGEEGAEPSLLQSLMKETEMRKEHKINRSPSLQKAYAVAKVKQLKQDKAEAAAKVEKLKEDVKRADRNVKGGKKLKTEVRRRMEIAVREQEEVHRELEAHQTEEARQKDEARKEAEARHKDEARKVEAARQKEEARKDEAAREKEGTRPHKEAPLKDEGRLHQQPQLPQVPQAPTELVDPDLQASLEAQAAGDEQIRDQLIRSLETHWAHTVDKAMRTKNHDTVLTTSTDKVPLTRQVFGQILPQKDADGKWIEKTTLVNGKVAPPGWLGDEPVNAFLSAIVASKNGYPMYRKSMKEVPPFTAFNSGWIHTHRDKGIEGLENWSKRKGIQGERLLQGERIFFPVNTGAHWTLIIISPRARTIEFIDSSLGKKQPWFDFARSWLQMELGDKYKAEEWEELPSMSEKQQNYDDCGVFTCMNALASAKNRPFSDVTATKDMFDARRMIAAVLLNGGMHGDWQL